VSNSPYNTPTVIDPATFKSQNPIGFVEGHLPSYFGKLLNILHLPKDMNGFSIIPKTKKATRPSLFFFFVYNKKPHMGPFIFFFKTW